MTNKIYKPFSSQSYSTLPDNTVPKYTIRRPLRLVSWVGCMAVVMLGMALSGLRLPPDNGGIEHGA